MDLPENKEIPGLSEAYEALESAIKGVIELNRWDTSDLGDERPPMMLGDFMVIATQQGFDGAGDGISSMALIVPNGQLPWHRMIGIVHQARLRVESLYLKEDDD